jgi:hypothetical protein
MSHLFNDFSVVTEIGYIHNSYFGENWRPYSRLRTHHGFSKEQSHIQSMPYQGHLNVFTFAKWETNSLRNPSWANSLVMVE